MHKCEGKKMKANVSNDDFEKLTKICCVWKIVFGKLCCVKIRKMNCLGMRLEKA